MDDVLHTAETWIKAGYGVALATVVKTWGSAPRPAGSLLAVRDDGTFAGSVSGGCVEGTVIEEASTAMKSRRPKRLEFGVSDEAAQAVGLACGGRIEIFVEPLDAA